MALDGLIRLAGDVLSKPIDEFVAAHAAGGEAKHEALLFIYRRVNLGAVEQEERCHRSVGNPLVAVDERMVLGERKPNAPAFSIKVG